MPVRKSNIQTWDQLARTLARRAEELRAWWSKRGPAASVADEQAQQTVCAALADWWMGSAEALARCTGLPVATVRGMRLSPGRWRLAQASGIQAGPAPAARAPARLLESIHRDLERADEQAIFADFDRRHSGHDPITAFYEHFLAAYSPRERTRQGVFYTPRAVTSFIVRGVDEGLQDQLRLARGLAEPDGRRRMQILDPAAGTGAFLIAVIEWLHQTLTAEWRAAGLCAADIRRRWSQWVSRVLRQRLAGCERIPAAAALANLNVTLKLWATGCRPVPQQAWVHTGDSFRLLGERSGHGLTIVIGNPPYAIRSSNAVTGVDVLLASYKQGLDEANLNALSDDYVKFFALAHTLVAQAGAGAIGFITNHSFLEGVTHRRMRALLLRDFDTVRVVDLHGSVMRRYEAPPGVNDENVFAIQQGVAITLLTRRPGRHTRGRLRHAEMWGSRASKCARLAEGPGSLKWRQPVVTEPQFAFGSTASRGDEDYARWPSLAEIFEVFSSGIKFRKDGLLVKSHFCRADTERMLRDVGRLSAHELTARYAFRETRDWRLEDKRALFRGARPEDIVAVMYRPFDVRHAYYPLERASRIIVRGDARVDLMRHVLSVPNIGLIFNRQIVGERVSHFLVSRRPVSHGCFYLGNKGQDYFAPLWLTDGTAVRANLAPAFVERLGRLPWPEPVAVLHYLYAVVYSPTYRTRYAGALRADFARIPLPGSRGLFEALARLGADLVGLHLLEDDYPAASWTRSGQGSPLNTGLPRLAGRAAPTIAPRHPQRHDGRVYLNPASWIEGVADAAWGLQVGGYDVCTKWLQARRGRTLTPDDLYWYGRMVRAAEATTALTDQIDGVIAAHGGWPQAFHRGQ